MMPALFRPEPYNAAEFDLAFGAPSVDGRANPRRFLADVRHGMTYPELRARYSLLGLDWGFADQAAPAEQLRVLLTGQQDTTHLLHDLAAIVTPNLSLETKADILRDVFSHDRLSTEATNFSVSATVAALIAGWPESLDFLLPSLLAPIADGSIRAQSVRGLQPLLMSPMLPKEAALELVWQLAETASRARRGAHEAGEREQAALKAVYEFARDRADLTAAERTAVNRAVTLVSISA